MFPAQKLKGIVQIFQPKLPFAAGLCVILGEIIALGNFPPMRDAALGFLCGFFISGSAIVLNDVFDLEVDKVNTPDRPLPAGIISPSEAILLTVIVTLIGLSAARKFDGEFVRGDHIYPWRNGSRQTFESNRVVFCIDGFLH